MTKYFNKSTSIIVYSKGMQRMTFKKFIKTKGSIAAIFMGIFYAIAMLGIFLPGYAAIPGNVDRLPVAIVNDDAGEYGAGIADEMESNLPFQTIETGLSNDEATDKLEQNKLALVMHIPETFSQDVENGEVSSSIEFTINQAGAATVSSTMNSVANEVNNQLRIKFSEKTAQGILMNFNVPEDQATELAEQIETAYAGNIVTINEIPNGMNNSNLPMFLTLAAYVGAMIGSMQLVGSLREHVGKTSKTRLFMYVQSIALMIAVVSSMIAIGIAFLINQPSGELFFKVVGQQVLDYMVFFNFTAILIFLFGQAGMVLNLPVLLIQTLANGAVIPREMMFAPYQWMSHISPMYYSVQAYFANLYGNISASPHIWSLVLVGIAALLINILIVVFLRKPKSPDLQGDLQAEQFTQNS